LNTIKPLLPVLIILITASAYSQTSQQVNYRDILLTCENNEVTLSGLSIKSVEMEEDKYVDGKYRILISTDQSGADLIEKFTTENVGKLLTLSSQEKEIVSAIIAEPIGQGKIALRPYSIDDANEIKKLLEKE